MRGPTRRLCIHVRVSFLVLAAPPLCPGLHSPQPHNVPGLSSPCPAPHSWPQRLPLPCRQATRPFTCTCRFRHLDQLPSPKPADRDLHPACVRGIAHLTDSALAPACREATRRSAPRSDDSSSSTRASAASRLEVTRSSVIWGSGVLQGAKAV